MYVCMYVCMYVYIYIYIYIHIMASPMHVLSYGLGVGNYIPPTVAVLGFNYVALSGSRLRCLFRRCIYRHCGSTLALHTYAADSHRRPYPCRPPLQTPGTHITLQTYNIYIYIYSYYYYYYYC